MLPRTTRVPHERVPQLLLQVLIAFREKIHKLWRGTRGQFVKLGERVLCVLRVQPLPLHSGPPGPPTTTASLCIPPTHKKSFSFIHGTMSPCGTMGFIFNTFDLRSFAGPSAVFSAGVVCQRSWHCQARLNDSQIGSPAQLAKIRGRSAAKTICSPSSHVSLWAKHLNGLSQLYPVAAEVCISRSGSRDLARENVVIVARRPADQSVSSSPPRSNTLVG